MLCVEITEYSDSTTHAVCNLASIAVNRFLKLGQPGDAWRTRMDWPALKAAAGQLTRNLNRVIDINTYPTPEAERSNLSLRPIGIGIQVRGSPLDEETKHIKSDNGSQAFLASLHPHG